MKANAKYAYMLFDITLRLERYVSTHGTLLNLGLSW